MDTLSNSISAIDEVVWGPVMLVLIIGTGIFLTIRLHFLPWRNLGYAIKMTFSKQARVTEHGSGDVSQFSALTTALAATIGTGNIVGVATAMVSGGPGALAWMWISACFGLSSKFSECMLSIKYREVNEKGEMSGGPMYTMKKAFPNHRIGAVCGWLFALFTVVASFGIGNMTQANSVSDSLKVAFHVPPIISGIILTVLALSIIVGGIQSISKVSSVVVPFMAIFYLFFAMIVLIGNIEKLPAGVAMIFHMAFSVQAVGGGLCGSMTAAMMNAMRFGVARGVFSNEAGMGSAAISAAAATTDSAVKQGYFSMTGTFWDTIVVCTITGLCIAASGVLGATRPDTIGRYETNNHQVSIYTIGSHAQEVETDYTIKQNGTTLILTNMTDDSDLVLHVAKQQEKETKEVTKDILVGDYTDETGAGYHFTSDGVYEQDVLIKGAALTILAFETVLGKSGSYLVCIGIVLFAFATILGWEYQGEKAFEYILGTQRFNIIYRILYSLIVYIGATTALDLVWNFSDIANALMAIPNLICLLALSGVIAKDTFEYQKVIKSK
jgi:AGCS family alanine or glycine:cation symporter